LLTSIDKPGHLRFTLQENKDSPVVNPAFVIKNHARGDLSLNIGGRSVPRGKDFRYSVEYDVEGVPSLIIWIKYAGEEKVEFEIR
jgi:hypothetical protein